MNLYKNFYLSHLKQKMKEGNFLINYLKYLVQLFLWINPGTWKTITLSVNNIANLFQYAALQILLCFHWQHLLLHMHMKNRNFHQNYCNSIKRLLLFPISLEGNSLKLDYLLLDCFPVLPLCLGNWNPWKYKLQNKSMILCINGFK